MTTTPSEPGGAPAGDAAPHAAPGAERRLHPLSWLFVLLLQLKQFILPIAIVLFGSARNEDSWYELFGLVGAGALVLVSVAQYFLYRWRIAPDGLVIRDGLVQRSVRHIPFARIHNVGLHQTLLHRLFGVAEVRLESAGGVKPEAEMRVLALADAHALEALVRRGAARERVADGATGVDALPADATLLALSTAEVVRAGLVSNRGMVVVASGFAVLAQTGSGLIGDGVRAVARTVTGYASELHLGVLGSAIGALALLAVFLVVLRVLSVALALLQFHGFTLSEAGRRLSVQSGLLTRMRASLPRHRIQAWRIHEGLLHRWFGRRALRVDTATVQAANETRALKYLAPIATPEAIDGLVRHLLPGAAWPALPWRGLHPRAWRRMYFWPWLATFAIAATACVRVGPWGLLALALLPAWIVRARVLASRARWAWDGRLLAVREGWIDRRWHFAEIGKLQSVQLVQGPFDRRHAMASVYVDTAGGNGLSPLRVRYLPEAEARALHAALGAEIARRRLDW